MRDPALKPFLTTRPAAAAFLTILVGLMGTENETACRRKIEDQARDATATRLDTPHCVQSREEFVDVQSLRNFGILGHLVELQDHRHIHHCPDELRRRDFHKLPRSLNMRDLSLQHHKQIDNLVDVSKSVGSRHAWSPG